MNSNISILFVEDEEKIRQGYVAYLKKTYSNVYEASCAQTALEIYKTKSPDIMIVDINLPSMSGLELVDMIRQNDHTTRIIMLTAYSDVEHLMSATKLKLTDYLVKPVSRLVLSNTLQKAIDEKEDYLVESRKTLHLEGGFLWDYRQEELYNNGNIVSLTSRESKIFALFVNNLNQVLTYDIIADEIYDYSFDDKVNSIKILIKELRKKLPKDTIVNVYGTGYKVIKL